MATDVAGRMNRTGANCAKYILTFTDVGPRLTFVIPVMCRAHVTHEITAALVYYRKNHGQDPELIHSDNTKEFLSKND